MNTNEIVVKRKSVVADLELLDTKTAAERGFFVHLEDPRTNEPLYDAEDKPIGITILGMDAEKVGSVTRKVVNSRFEERQKNRGASDVQTIENVENDRVVTLAAATISWNLPLWRGESLECNDTNARKLYSNPKFPWIVEQLDKAIGDRRRFFN